VLTYGHSEHSASSSLSHATFEHGKAFKNLFSSQCYSPKGNFQHLKVSTAYDVDMLFFQVCFILGMPK